MNENALSDSIDMSPIALAHPPATAVIEPMPAHSPARNSRQVTPGRISTQATLIIQTRTAQRFFSNRIGVTEFSKKVTRIWSAAAADDPYADLYLLRIYDAIVSARRTLSILKEQYTQLFQEEEGVRLTLGKSEQPLEFTLQFATPYGYMSAYLLADYDKLARQIHSARRLGLLDTDPIKALNEATQVIKAVLRTPNSWQSTEITRADLVANNEVAKKAAKLMGKISVPIKEGKLRAPHAPVIRKSRKEAKDA